MNNIAIFASGGGTNAENIISHFSGSKENNIELILCNKSDAFVIQRAKNHNIKSIVFNKEEFTNPSKVLDTLKKNNINFIVLAGFLWLMPKHIVEHYKGRIINIHPALLPAYGGKGMYGDNVHKAIIEAGEKKSGITIHQVNELFDDGDIIFQAEVEINNEDTPDTLAQKIHTLEYRHFPTIIEQTINATPSGHQSV